LGEGLPSDLTGGSFRFRLGAITGLGLMTQTEEQRPLLIKIVSALTILSGLILAIYTVTGLGHGPFPFGAAKILKIALGISLALAGWIAGSRERRHAAYRALKLLLLVRSLSCSWILVSVGFIFALYAVTRLGHGPFPFGTAKILKIALGVSFAWAAWIAGSSEKRQAARRVLKGFLFPAHEQRYSPSILVVLTVVMFAGMTMVVWAVLSPSLRWHAEFLQRSREMGLGGAALALTSGLLRYGRRNPERNVDWPKPAEVLSLFALALLVTAVDIYFSRRVGSLAYPPYYDGVGYLFDAKKAFVQLGLWKLNPAAFANVFFGNRYPLWQGLMVLNFRLFGVGEWQAYAVRFWPTFLVLMSIFWIVRRRKGACAGYAAALFTALLPTLCLNLRSAALGHEVSYHGYLADLRPDILFAAFVMLAVVFMIEHAQSFDEWTSLLAGSAAAFAMLTKSTAISAVVLACGSAALYVLWVNRKKPLSTLSTMLWALLAMAILLMPWILAGGIEMTVTYVKLVFTDQLARYSNPHATFQSEITHYWTWLVQHMGPETVVLAILSPVFLLLSRKNKGSLPSPIHQQIAYFVIAASLYVLVSATPAKNFFLGLPCYLVLWIYCWASFTSVPLSKFLNQRVAWGLLSLAVLTVSIVGIRGMQNLRSWQGHEFEEGRQDRAVMQQVALDLRQVLSNHDSFVTMAAYGSPSALLFYMPDEQGEFPHSWVVNGTNAPPVPEYLQRLVEPAKAVLIYAGGNDRTSFKAYVEDVDYPYYRAIAAWVQRPGSSFRLVKSYNFYRERGGSNAALQLYVKDDQNPPKRDSNVFSSNSLP